MPAKAGIRTTLNKPAKWILGRAPAFAGVTLVVVLLSVLPAFAEEDATEKTYLPDHCEFTVTFPAEPSIAKRCPGGQDCYEVVRFTQVYDFTTTVNMTITCNPVDEKMAERYTGEVIKATLEGMVGRNAAIKDYTINAHDEGKMKVASLVGDGQVGLTPMLYTAQIWIGKTSIFTVEAELIGKASEEADAIFRDILVSIHHIDDSDKKEEAEENESDKPEEEKEQ